MRTRRLNKPAVPATASATVCSPESYGQDPEFFAFYRSMTAYENGLKSNDTRFLLRPDSEFFRFFANPSGKPPRQSRSNGVTG